MEAAGTGDVRVSMTVKDVEGKTKYTVKVEAENLKAGEEAKDAAKISKEIKSSIKPKKASASVKYCLGFFEAEIENFMSI